MKTINSLRDISETLAGAKTIVLASGASHPQVIADQLDADASLWPDLTVRTFMPLGPCPFVRNGGLTTSSAFPGGILRKAANDEEVEIIRDSFGEHAMAYRAGRKKADILVIQIAPAEQEGLFHLGPSVDLLPDILAQNPFVIAVINRRVPRCGPTIRAETIDVAITDDRTLLEMPTARADEIDRQIAANVCTLLDGDAITLETGIGAVPEAVLRMAGSLPRLSIHTGLINDAVMDIVPHLGRPVTATMAAGTQDFYRFLDDNKAIDLKPASHTHSLETLSAIPRFHAVNGALQVDLTGAVNTEIAGGRFISTPGGLPDFAAGAKLSPGGRSIIALRSTARRSGTSTVVPQVERVSVAGKLVDFVVTEYGAADLRDVTGNERARRIAAIAHPDHRSDLLKEVKDL